MYVALAVVPKASRSIPVGILGILWNVDEVIASRERRFSVGLVLDSWTEITCSASTISS